ncbi:MAG: hypothetical protein R3B70_17240 [Polyangiaceae bacterium]
MTSDRPRHRLSPGGLGASPRLRALGAAAGLALCLSAQSGRADGPLGGVVDQSRDHFEAGREAMKTGDLKKACAEFAASLSINPAPGPLINLAVCEEKRGRVASALARYEEIAATLPESDSRVGFARTKIRDLLPRTPTLTVQIEQGAPEGCRVLLDDRQVPVTTLGTPMRLDPGSYTLSFAHPDRPEETLAIKLAEGDRRRVTFGAGPAVARPEEPAAAAGSATPETEPTAAAGPAPLLPTASAATGPAPTPPMSMTRKLGIGVMATGGAGLIAGAVLGAIALDVRDQLRSLCPASGSEYVCPPSRQGAVDLGFALAQGSTLAFAIGGVALATGTLFVIVGGGKDKPAVAVRPMGPGLALEGQF